jgi:hypothetical protein
MLLRPRERHEETLALGRKADVQLTPARPLVICKQSLVAPPASAKIALGQSMIVIVEFDPYASCTVALFQVVSAHQKDAETSAAHREHRAH